MRSHSTKSLRRNITNKPARPKRVQRVASELALIKAFEELLQSKGVDGIGVNAVLNRAGVGKRLLYEYFGDLTSLAKVWAKTHRSGRSIAPSSTSRARASPSAIRSRPPAPASWATSASSWAKPAGVASSRCAPPAAWALQRSWKAPTACAGQHDRRLT